MVRDSIVLLEAGEGAFPTVVAAIGQTARRLAAGPIVRTTLQFVTAVVDQTTKHLSVVVIHLFTSFNSSPPAVGAWFHVSPIVLLPVLAVVPFGSFTRANEEHDARQSAEYNGANVGGNVSLHFVSASLSNLFVACVVECRTARAWCATSHTSNVHMSRLGG